MLELAAVEITGARTALSVINWQREVLSAEIAAKSSPVLNSSEIVLKQF